MDAYPFPHAVIEDAFPLELIRAATQEWPDDSWQHWVRYDNAIENKRTCCDLSKVGPACKELMLRVQNLPEMSELVSDPDWYAAGMHDMGIGGYLGTHLDADRHPKTGHARAWNAILFLCEGWKQEWGGALQLWPPALDKPAVEIFPGTQLVLFKPGDLAYHSVSKLTCPPEVRRRTLACFWWEPTTAPGIRPRARFVRTAQEAHDPEVDALRVRRATFSM